MKFVDSAKIFIRSGKGGAGCASMRHEKYVEFGGPNGGDGGKGGDVYFAGDERLTSLYDLRMHPHQNAKNGMPGLGDQKTGRSGEDKIIFVPFGSILINDDTDEVLFEVLDETPKIALRGGKGGRGNVHFKSSTNRAPRYAQPGEPGMDMRVRLELKLIADVGLVGFPNAGKSTLISSISNARPKIADYPFTTIAPNLGVVSVGEYKTIVVADIPGIIEDAHIGTGLGDRFLKHIQRTKVLAFLIDVSGFDEVDPMETYRVLLNELGRFSPDLLNKKRIILLSKIDSIRDDIDLNQTIKRFKEEQEIVLPISSVTRSGLDVLIVRLFDLVQSERSDTSETN